MTRSDAAAHVAAHLAALAEAADFEEVTGFQEHDLTPADVELLEAAAEELAGSLYRQARMRGV